MNKLAARVQLPGLTRLRQYFHTAKRAEQLIASAGLERSQLHPRFFGPFIYLSRLTENGTRTLLRRWEPVDDRLADKPRLRNLANVLIVAAWKPTDAHTLPPEPAKP